VDAKRTALAIRSWAGCALAAALTTLTALAWAPPAGAQEVVVEPRLTFETGHGEPVAPSFSSDGRRILAASRSGQITVRSLADSATAWEGQHPVSVPVRFAAFLEGDSLAVTVDEDGGIALHPLFRAGDPTWLEGSGLAPVRFALDPDRRILAMAGDGRIEVVDLRERRRVGVIEAGGALRDPLFLAFDRWGGQLQALSVDGTMTAFSPGTLEPLRQVTLQSSTLAGSRTRLHAAGQDGTANILVTALEEVALPRGGLRGQARPGDLVRRDLLLVFDWHSGTEIRQVVPEAGVVDALVVGPGNDHVVMARGAEIRVVDLRRGAQGVAIESPGPVGHLAIDRQAELLAVATSGGEVAVWSMEYRERTLAEQLNEPDQGGLAGRLRILGDDAPAIPSDEPAVLAILPFDDRDGDGALSRTLANFLTTQLANLEHLTVVERLRLDALLEEQELARQGITEPGGLRLGRLLNARYVVLGSIGTSGSSFTFSARIMDTETGEVRAGRTVFCEECRPGELFEAIEMLGYAIAR
jgi:TolB-like protein